MSDSKDKCALLEQALTPILSEAEGYLEVLVDDIHLASDLDKAKLALALLESISDPIAFEVDEAKKSVSAVISYFEG